MNSLTKTNAGKGRHRQLLMFNILSSRDLICRWRLLFRKPDTETNGTGSSVQPSTLATDGTTLMMMMMMMMMMIVIGSVKVM